MNAVEREPVPTRVLNPNASEATYKPNQRSYRKTWAGGNFPGGSIPRADKTEALGRIYSWPTLGPTRLQTLSSDARDANIFVEYLLP